MSEPETGHNAGVVQPSQPSQKGAARRRFFSFFVAALVFLACAAAVGIQIANLPSVLKARAERAFASGDFAGAMKFFIRIRRIEHDSRPLQPKMREIAHAGIGKHYERSKALLDQGLFGEALGEYTAAMALADDYFLVFPAEQLLPPASDDLLVLLDAMRDDSCFMGKIYALSSEWDNARIRLQECEKQSSLGTSPLLWQTYIFSITWDWERASGALQKLVETSGMGLLLRDFEEHSRREKVRKTSIKALVPDDLQSAWTLVESLKWYDLSQLIERTGMRLISPGNMEIGSTGVLAPCDIVVRSAGVGNGDYGDILLNGAGASTDLRGYNFVAIDQNSGKLLAADHFDAVGHSGDNQKLEQVIGSLPSGTIVVLAAKGKAKVDPDLLSTFQSIGATFAMTEPDRLEWSHCVIGVKGAPPGSALERHGRGASFLEVCGPRDYGKDQSEIEAYLTRTATQEHRPVIYMSGKRLDSDVLLAVPGPE